MSLSSNGSEDSVPSQTRLVVALPRVFSLVSEPESALPALRHLRDALDRGFANVVLDASAVSHLDPCAACVLVASMHDRTETRVEIDLPENDDVLNCFATGGLKHLIEQGQVHERREGRMQRCLTPLFRMLPGRRDSLAGDIDSLIGTDANRIADRLDAWSRSEGFVFQPEFRSLLTGAVLEAIENIWLHTHDDWWFSAHLERGTEKGWLIVTVFNFGTCIADSLRSAPKDGRVSRLFEKLREEHARAAGFDDVFCVDNLLTLLAIQDGISSKASERERGAGTAKWLRLLEYLLDTDVETEAVVVWVTGSTSITLDRRYRRRPSHLDERRGYEDIALNKANDLRERPDPHSLRNLNTAFPGTLVTARLGLRDRLLSDKEGAL